MQIGINHINDNKFVYAENPYAPSELKKIDAKITKNYYNNYINNFGGNNVSDQ